MSATIDCPICEDPNCDVFPSQWGAPSFAEGDHCHCPFCNAWNRWTGSCWEATSAPQPNPILNPRHNPTRRGGVSNRSGRRCPHPSDQYASRPLKQARLVSAA